jgi:FKBP-type peptidyl-prolyl cis-trans isomerase
MLIILGCSSNNGSASTDDSEINSWEDSVSYSIGGDVGTTLLKRRVNVDPEELYSGFQKSYEGDSSYFIGSDIGSSYRRQGINVDPELFFKGFKASYLKEQSKLRVDEMISVVQRYEIEIRKARFEEANRALEEIKVAGMRFMEEYQKNPNVKSTESGLLYRVLIPGYGEIPEASDRVRVHYTGKLMDGTVFDSSVSRNEPSVFGVNEVIPGWREALQLMKVGGKWELVIPPDLAYGENGAGSMIGPNATLLFEVELLGIESE